MDTEVVKDNINPDHYKSSTSLECIEAMQIAFGEAAVIDFCVCNAWKYIWRWKNKNGVEDLHKAEWYINKGWELILDSAVAYNYSNQKDVLLNMRHYVLEILENEEFKEGN
jgi:hypothetical protein